MTDPSEIPPQIQNWTNTDWSDVMIELVRTDFRRYGAIGKPKKFLHWDDKTRLWLPTTQNYLYDQVTTRLNQHLLNLGLTQSFIARHVKSARLVSYKYNDISLDEHMEPKWHRYGPKSPKLDLTDWLQLDDGNQVNVMTNEIVSRQPRDYITTSLPYNLADVTQQDLAKVEQFMTNLTYDLTAATTEWLLWFLRYSCTDRANYWRDIVIFRGYADYRMILIKALEAILGGIEGFTNTLTGAETTSIKVYHKRVVFGSTKVNQAAHYRFKTIAANETVNSGGKIFNCRAKLWLWGDQILQPGLFEPHTVYIELTRPVGVVTDPVVLTELTQWFQTATGTAAFLRYILDQAPKVEPELSTQLTELKTQLERG